ncbi:hypothetical protein DPEC_G00036720 [Dallia pectoralis]|uniref:Uncharacterized protein n=1 Tax=Dallia pectoralis TaxID=75939 RepID=A0ACC2HDM0_DALPE|nr:hypothetical protein DPEC_G00036720 [Dallia pectoralis]
MGERSTVEQQERPPSDGGLCNYAQKIGSCFGLDGKNETETGLLKWPGRGESPSGILAELYLECCTLLCGTAEGESGDMPTLTRLSKLCSSSRSHRADRPSRVKRQDSVKRLSVLEDGEVAEVLYLIPKVYMQQLPFINPNDYYLSERLIDIAPANLCPEELFSRARCLLPRPFQNVPTI